MKNWIFGQTADIPHGLSNCEWTRQEGFLSYRKSIADLIEKKAHKLVPKSRKNGKSASSVSRAVDGLQTQVLSGSDQPTTSSWLKLGFGWYAFGGAPSIGLGILERLTDKCNTPLMLCMVIIAHQVALAQLL